MEKIENTGLYTDLNNRVVHLKLVCKQRLSIKIIYTQLLPYILVVYKDCLSVLVIGPRGVTIQKLIKRVISNRTGTRCKADLKSRAQFLYELYDARFDARSNSPQMASLN